MTSEVRKLPPLQQSHECIHNGFSKTEITITIKGLNQNSVRAEFTNEAFFFLVAVVVLFLFLFWSFRGHY